MTPQIARKQIRRLVAAEGYLELGMPEHALRELEVIDRQSPLHASAQYLRGWAFKDQELYNDAIGPLQQAAELIPAPHNFAIWMLLSECFRSRGQEDVAVLVESFANSSRNNGEGTPVLNVTVNVFAALGRPKATEETDLDDDDLDDDDLDALYGLVDLDSDELDQPTEWDPEFDEESDFGF